MPIVRFQNTLQDRSNMAKDRYVNTYHVFMPGAPEADDLGDVTAAIIKFHKAIGNRYGHQVRGSTHSVKSYNMEVPEGSRVPLSNVTYTLDSVGPPIPAEVAFVLTLEAKPVPGVEPQSTRGRIFLGPLSVDVLNAPSGDFALDSRPADAFITASLTNLTTLIADIHAVPTCNLGILSQRQHNSDLSPGSRRWYPVVSISADNSWDTQRSRGDRATARTRIGIAGAEDLLAQSW